MYSMIYYFMWFWKDHVAVHMFKNQIMHRILMKKCKNFKNFKFSRKLPHMLIPFIVLNKIHMLMEKVMTINRHGMQNQ